MIKQISPRKERLVLVGMSSYRWAGVLISRFPQVFSHLIRFLVEQPSMGTFLAHDYNQCWSTQEKKQEQKSTNLRGGGKKETTFPSQKRDAMLTQDSLPFLAIMMSKNFKCVSMMGGGGGIIFTAYFGNVGDLFFFPP